VVRETGETELRVDWRALLEACGPSAALVEQEKAAGASPGGVISLKLAETHVGERGARRRGQRRGTGLGDGRGDRRGRRGVRRRRRRRCARRSPSVCSSASGRYAGRWSARTTETPGTCLWTRSRPRWQAAGFGPRTFGPDEARWALAACHHPFAENAVLYPKFLALVVVATEREVFRRADAAGAMARARQVALDAEDARRRAWVADTVRVASETADAAATQAKARLRSEHTAESRWATDVARRDAAYRARASCEGW
jgi:hypothetical protein